MTDNTIQIIYASTSGNTELVCEKVMETLKSKGIDVEMNKAETVDIKNVIENSNFILATSTWEHGVVNPNFNSLLAKMSKLDLAGKRAGFIGLGDTRYEPVEFCGGMEEVKKIWLAQGGEEVFMPLKLNGEPHEVLDTLVVRWVEQLVIKLFND